MSHPVFEIVYFNSSKLYQSGAADTLSGLVEILKQSPGQISTYHAPQVEDPTKAYLFTQWQTYEDSKAVIEAESNEFLAAAAPSSLSTSTTDSKSPLERYHVKFDRDPSESLQAPATEICIATLKEPSQRDVLARCVASLASLVAKGKISAAWGTALEDENTFLMVAGWQSVNDDMATREAATAEQKSAFKMLLKIADLHGEHAQLVKYI